MKTRLNPLFIVFLFVGSAVNAQFIQGSVLDATSKEPLSFVQIGVVNKNVGVLSDEKGQFKLDSPKIQESDSIIFSYLGYEIRTILLKDLMNSSEVSLKKQVFSLPKIDVKAEALTKNRTLGYNKTNSRLLTVGWSVLRKNIIDNPVGERGIIIKLKGKTALVKNVNFHIADNEFDSVTCRVHLYTIKDGLPDKEITTENIFVQTTKKHGWVKVPIDHLQIIIQEDIIVTIELVKARKKEPIIGEGFLFSSGFFGNVVSREVTHQTNWKVSNNWRMGLFLDVKTN